LTPFIKKLLRADDGATAVEYAVVLSLILMTAFVSIAAVGVKTSGLWSTIYSMLKAVGIAT
jgi:Flp pilus assembly pilin Flp